MGVETPEHIKVFCWSIGAKFQPANEKSQQESTSQTIIFQGRPYHLTRHTRAPGELLPPRGSSTEISKHIEFHWDRIHHGEILRQIFWHRKPMVRMEGQQPQEKTRVFVKFTFYQKEGNLLKYPKSWGEFVQRHLMKFGDLFLACVVFWMHRCYTKGIRKNSSLACSQTLRAVVSQITFLVPLTCLHRKYECFYFGIYPDNLWYLYQAPTIAQLPFAQEIPTLNSSEPKMESVGRQSFLFRSMFKGMFC